jgi:hypothetical protein
MLPPPPVERPGQRHEPAPLDSDVRFGDSGLGEADTPQAPRQFHGRALLVLWPAFMMAALLEAVVFTVVDPTLYVPAPAAAVYSLGFLLFWLAIATASAITMWLAAPGPWQAH